MLRYQLHMSQQGRREPNVGPGPAQIHWISGSVNSKTDGENAALKRSSQNSNGFSGRN